MLLFALCSANGGAAPARAQDGPKIVKTWVFAGVHQTWHAWSPTSKKFVDNSTSWMPSLKFSLIGPTPAGSQLSVDFTKPNGAAWLSMDCRTDELKAGEWGDVKTARDTSTAGEKKYITGVGIFGFKIRLKNELSGTNKVLLAGKFKVGKVSRFNGTPRTKNENDYYVDHDWVMPMGYLYFRPDSVSPPLSAAMWFKGEVYSSDMAAYLFYNGKQIGSTKDQGDFSTTEEDLRTISGNAGDPHWQLWRIQWYNVAENVKDPNDVNAKLHYLDKNPGKYEIKVLRKGKLSRQASFTVGADGKIADNGVGTANNLNSNRVLIPVKVLGTGDGTWQKAAWKTDAFYKNPLKGFTAP